MKPRIRAYVVIGLIAMVLLSAVTAGFIASRGATKAAPLSNIKLSKHDQELIASAIVNKKPTVSLMIAVLSGTTNQTVITGLTALGAQVKYQDTKARYIRVSVPTKNADKVIKVAGIEAVGVDDTIQIDNPTANSSGGTTQAVPAPGPGTPSANPYMPTQDTGAQQFVAANPTFDGRGVKIGIVDSGVDVLTPELQTAKNKAGQDIRKIADWVTATDPGSADGTNVGDNDPTWIYTSITVTAKGSTPTFVYNGVTYTAPYAGKFRLGFFDATDPRLNGDPAEDSDLGDQIAALYPSTVTNVFPVLVSNDGYDVWVDTTQNKSFKDEKDMTQYNNRYDIGVFGTPSTPAAGDPRTTIPFVVQTDAKNKLVNIGIVSGSHGTHVAGITAGKGFFGGAYNGAAPNAQIVSVRVCVFAGGCTDHGLYEGMIYAVRDAGVDVVNMSIGGYNPFDDGNNATEVLYNNLIEQYDVQIFISAGNSGSGVNTVGEPSLASKVVSVGAYFSADTLFYNYGNVASKASNIFYFSSRGPRADGGLKPDIIAPGAAVSSIPGNLYGEPVAGTYTLPPGYGMYNGTSMASPQATGAAALLLSAAKQTSGVDAHNAANLRQAIKSTSTYIAGYQPIDEGNGLFNVGAAWNMLKAKHIDAYMGLSSTAPVVTAAADFLTTPDSGPGVYLREGVKAGDSLTKTITLRRDDPQGSGTMKFTITLVGNDGTFSAPTSVSLPMHTPVTISLGIHPTTSGVHSVLLNLTTPESDGVVYQVLNTVIAAEQYSVAGNYSTPAETGSVDRNNGASGNRYFFNVPAGATAFHFDASIVNNGRLVATVLHDPYGLPIYTAAPFTGPATLSKTVSISTPGVYELEFDASRAAVPTQTNISLTTSILGVTLAPTSWTVNPATIGSTYTQSFTATNSLAALNGAIVGTDLGSAEKLSSAFTAGNSGFGFAQEVDFAVPAGQDELSVTIGNASNPNTDLDLYLFEDIGGGNYVQIGSSTSSTPNEQVIIGGPDATNYAALVVPFTVPTNVTYDFTDVYTSALNGTITTPDAPAVHAAGTSWSTLASVTPLANPGAGRFLQGFVQVVSGGAVLASSEADLTTP